MRVSLTIGGTARPAELARELAGTLEARGQFRGRLSVTEPGSRPGALGAGVAAVLIDLTPALLATFASVLIAWIRHGTGDARVTVRRPDGARFEISARRVRGLGTVEVQALTQQMVEALDGQPAAPPANNQPVAPPANQLES